MKRHSLFALVILLSCASARAADQAAPSRLGVELATIAQRFVDGLTPEQRAVAVMPFDDPRRLDWHNIPKPERKGVQLRDMTKDQRTICHELLRRSLSKDGYQKLERILSLENNLKEGEKNLTNGHLRDPERYFLTIFGKPGPTGTWGWSFEGHHMSQNFVVRDGQVVCDTPSFWGANPATVRVFVPGGPEVGVRTLTSEEQLAFDLLASLDDAQRAKAVIADKAPNDYRGPGTPQPPQDPAQGLPASAMTDAQKKILRSLLETYSGHLADELAAARMAEIDAAGFDNVHFAWLGASKPGVGHSYRVEGPTFDLELVNIQADPQGNPANHIHSVWRHLPTDFGVAK